MEIIILAKRHERYVQCIRPLATRTDDDGTPRYVASQTTTAANAATEGLRRLVACICQSS